MLINSIMTILKKDQTEICPICSDIKSLAKKYCSKECRKIGVTKSLKKTCIEKYGIDNPSKLESIKSKKIETSLKNYGVKNPLQSSAVKQKSKNTCSEKYGVDNPQKNREIRQKTKNTCNERYGVDNPGANEIVRQNMKTTCIKKYGVEYNWQSENTKEKIRITNNERYGVDYPMQNSTIFEKMQISGNKIKNYVFKSGRIAKVRGYEPLALDILVTKYLEDDIVVTSKNMPTIWYELNGKRKRYHPDIFIISENKFIEVKSTYTYNADLEKNLTKQKACEDNNFGFEFMIFDRNRLI